MAIGINDLEDPCVEIVSTRVAPPVILRSCPSPLAPDASEDGMIKRTPLIVMNDHHSRDARKKANFRIIEDAELQKCNNALLKLREQLDDSEKKCKKVKQNKRSSWTNA